MDDERREQLTLLMTNYVQLTPTGPYKFTIVESRAPRSDGGRVVGFRENMDIKFLRAARDRRHARTPAKGGVHAVANGSEAKIADSMLRVLHQQGVLGDAATDLRFNMRPGGNPERRDFGGVVEVFTAHGRGSLEIKNRFGEPVAVERAGAKVDLGVPLEQVVAARRRGLARAHRGAARRSSAALLEGVGGMSAGRLFGPDDAAAGAGERADRRHALERVRDALLRRLSLSRRARAAGLRRAIATRAAPRRSAC